MDLTLDDSPPPSPPKQNGGPVGQVIDLVSDDEDASARAGKSAVFPPALADTEASARRKPPSEVSGNKNGNATPPSATSRAFSNSNSRKASSSSTNTYLHFDGTWSCPTCTLNNSATATRCEACDGLKPIDESVGWRCEFCYQYGSEHGRYARATVIWISLLQAFRCEKETHLV